MKTEYRKISDKRKKTGQGRYPEWDFYDAMDGVLGHKPSTQPAVVVDTLEDSQVQDTQVDDDLLHDTEGEAAVASQDTSDVTVPSPIGSSDVTDTSSEVATTSQRQNKSADKVLTRKQKRHNKFDVTRKLLDKLIGMQEKSDEMLMELEMKRARLEEKQMEMDMPMKREEREFQLQMMNIMDRNRSSMLPPGPSSYPTYGYSGYDPDATQDGL